MFQPLSIYGLGVRRLPVAPIPAPMALPNIILSDTAKSSVTGKQVDDKFASQIIGKDIPIFVGGQALIGCRICEGPFITTVDGAGYVSMIVTAALACVPTATRELQSIRLNGTESFTSSDGGATWTAVGSVFDDVEINVLYGTETQTPLSSSIDRYGARAVPYRSHICVELKNIPLSVFNNVIPFVSVFVHEADSISRRDAITRLAQFCRYDTSELEINVSGSDTFWIVAEQSTFIGFLQGVQRTIGRNWNIAASDKLYVSENSSTETPVVITRDDIVADSIVFEQVDPLAIPAQRSLEFIDTDRDNAINSVRAVRARFPIPLTASADSESFGIPIGMAALSAKTAVNKSLLIDDIGRDRFRCKLMPHMRGIQPGDQITPDVDDDISFPVGRIISIARNSSDWTLDIVAERIEVSLLSTGPTITSDSTITVDEEDGVSVVTVTSDQEGVFSIIGGDDALLFTIDPDTGVLEFLTEPDFEDPQDANTDNVYEVIVQILAGSGLSGSQAITITVSNASELGGSPMGLLLSLTYT